MVTVISWDDQIVLTTEGPVVLFLVYLIQTQIAVFMTNTRNIDELYEIIVWTQKFRKCTEIDRKCNETENNEQLSVSIPFHIVKSV